MGWWMSEEEKVLKGTSKVARNCRLTYGQLRKKPELRWSLTRPNYENEWGEESTEAKKRAEVPL